MTCNNCGGPIRADNKRGYCRRTEACKKANNQAYFEDNKERIADRQAAWYRENSERLLAKQATYRATNAQAVRDTRRRHGYKLEPEDYALMLIVQDGKCRGCGRNDVELHIDHDHACCPEIPTCGKCNRGLLCDRCNRGIGFVQDNPATLRALADYLEAWNQNRMQA